MKRRPSARSPRGEGFREDSIRTGFQVSTTGATKTTTNIRKPTRLVVKWGKQVGPWPKSSLLISSGTYLPLTNVHAYMVNLSGCN